MSPIAVFEFFSDKLNPLTRHQRDTLQFNITVEEILCFIESSSLSELQRSCILDSHQFDTLINAAPQLKRTPSSIKFGSYIINNRNWVLFKTHLQLLHEEHTLHQSFFDCREHYYIIMHSDEIVLTCEIDQKKYFLLKSIENETIISNAAWKKITASTKIGHFLQECCKIGMFQ